MILTDLITSLETKPSINISKYIFYYNKKAQAYT